MRTGARAQASPQGKFATKPELAKDLIIRPLDDGVPARWRTGDAVSASTGDCAGAHRFALWTLLADPLGRGRRQGQPPLRLGPGDSAYFIRHAPARVSLAELVRVAGARWVIEETFQTARGETCLDQAPDHPPRLGVATQPDHTLKKGRRTGRHRGIAGQGVSGGPMISI